MTNRYLCAALIGAAFLSSCSRPTAYFQRESVKTYAAAQAETAPVAGFVAEESAVVASPAKESAQPEVLFNQVETYVRTDSKLATNRKLSQRMDRVRKLLHSSSTSTTPRAALNSQPSKMGMVERLMLKKVNKRISRQMAPANPDKAMINSGLLTGGAVLLLIGLLLLLLTTGTAAAIGLILGVIGIIALILGLIAS